MTATGTGTRTGAGSNSHRALVFGAGGVLGFAWTLGALRALEIEWGVDANAVALNVGTSAGSMLAALLGCGVRADAIRRHHQGIPAATDPRIDWNYGSDSGGAMPSWPGLRPGSPRLLLDAVRRPGSVPPAVALSGLLPRGRGSLEPIRAVISAAARAAGPARGPDAAGGGNDDPAAAGAGVHAEPGAAGGCGSTPGANWPAQPQTWVVATDYHNGARTVFGRDDTVTAPVELGDAVAASCAIPGWYAPMPIGGRLYTDGGAASNASADLVEESVLAGTVDEVFILAPMASVEPDRPRSPLGRLDRAMRRSVTRGVQHDAARLRKAGARVVVLTPGAYDLDAMGANLMNSRRRTDVLETSLLTSATTLREVRLSMGMRDVTNLCDGERVLARDGTAGAGAEPRVSTGLER